VTLPPAFGNPLPWVHDGQSPRRAYVQIATGEQKTAYMIQLAIHGATFEPLVRDTAVALMRGLPLLRGAADEHVPRLRRLQEFVRDSVPYHGEAIEILQAASNTLEHGGDCDDHVILLGALAWSMRYPFAIIATGDPADPYHYTIALGYPPGDHPSGSSDTLWLAAETTIPAELGEELSDAMQRTQTR